MEKKHNSIAEAISKTYFQEVDVVGDFPKVDRFFELETKLLHQVYNLEEANAKVTMAEVIGILTERFGKEAIKGMSTYFIVLSSIIARKLLDNQVPAKKAFAFNFACTEVISTMSEASFLQVADELIEFYIDFIADRKQPTYRHQTVNKVIMYINDELESNLTVENIAKHFHISTSHLSRIFREHVGITLVEYLNIRRVEESQYYLRHTTKSITAISNQFHFCNQSYFTRIFKKYAGVTPKHFRDKPNYPFYRFELNELAQEVVN